VQQGAETTVQAKTQAGGDAQTKAGNLQEDELQSRTDKLLVVTFAALLQLDKKAGLAITPAEAKAMLPIVRKGAEQGELSVSDQQALDDTLTADQAKFVADFRVSVDRRRESRKELTPQEREAIIARFEELRRRETAAGDAGKKAGPAAAGSGTASLGGGASTPAASTGGGSLPAGADGPKRSGDRTIEQQLIDVLEAKLAGSGTGAASPQKR
jgi:hypothetical protein